MRQGYGSPVFFGEKRNEKGCEQVGRRRTPGTDRTVMSENANKTLTREEDGKQVKMKSLALDLVETGTDEANRAADLKVTKHLPDGVTSRMLYADIVHIAWPSLVELTLTPELAKMRLACMESSMASVSRNAVESFRTRWVSGSLSMSSLPS